MSAARHPLSHVGQALRRLVSAGVGLALLGGLGCGPSPLYDLRPRADVDLRVPAGADSSAGRAAGPGALPTTFFLEGLEYCRVRGDSTEWIVAYDRNDHKRLSFDMVVVNRGRNARLISPADVSLVLPANQKQGSSERILAARDPEPELLRLDSQLSEESNQRTLMMAFELVQIAGELAEDLTPALRPDTPEGLAAQDERHAEQLADREEARAFHEAHQSGLEQKKQWWIRRALRATTLPPGVPLRGVVLFPPAGPVQQVRLRLRCQAGETLELPFSNQRPDSTGPSTPSD
ncbi:MAG: hypothetical protein WC326_09950 [Candidatus Delongbacteria bacterium]